MRLAIWAAAPPVTSSRSVNTPLSWTTTLGPAGCRRHRIPRRRLFRHPRAPVSVNAWCGEDLTKQVVADLVASQPEILVPSLSTTGGCWPH
jgi:hypothetical protein